MCVLVRVCVLFVCVYFVCVCMCVCALCVCVCDVSQRCVVVRLPGKQKLCAPLPCVLFI